MHGHAGQGGGQLGIAPDHDHDDDDETGHAHEAGEHAGDEQVGDALFRKDAVDDEIRARRDEAADAAGTGQRPDGQLVVIAVPPHFGQGDGHHGDTADQGVAHHRAEGGTGAHAGYGEAAAEMAAPVAGRAVQVFAEPAVETEEAHQQKEHQGRPRVTAARGEPCRPEQVQSRRQAAQAGDEDERGPHEREGHGHPQEKHGKHIHHADDALRGRADAGQTLDRHPNRQSHAEQADAEHQESRPHPAAPDNGGKLIQKMAEHGKEQQDASEHGEPDERLVGHVPYRGGVGGGHGVLAHAGYAEKDDRKAPDRGDGPKPVLIEFAQLAGHDVHADVPAPPIGIGHGGKQHHGHEHFGDFDAAADRRSDNIAQKHIREGQDDQTHKDIHADSAYPLAKRFRAPYQGR